MSNNQEENIQCDDFTSIVKISYIKNGSGIIFLPKSNSQYAYILTAKHNFEDNSNNLVLVDDLNYQNIQVKYKEYNEDDFIDIPVKDIFYLDIDLALLIVELSIIDKEVIKIIPILNIFTNKFSHCIFKGYPNISDNDIKCLYSKHHAKLNKDLFTITTEQQQSTIDFSALENTVGFSGSGLLTAFNKKPVLTGLLTRVSNSFNEINCINLSVVYNELNNKLNQKEYPQIEIIQSESIESNKLNKIESINTHQTTLATDGSTSGKHQKIINYLEKYNIKEAKKLLKTIKEPTGETFRLNALVALTDKNIVLAYENIEKAKNKEVVPNDLEFVQGLTYYFSSISENGYEKLSPYPINQS